MGRYSPESIRHNLIEGDELLALVTAAQLTKEVRPVGLGLDHLVRCHHAPKLISMLTHRGHYSAHSTIATMFLGKNRVQGAPLEVSMRRLADADAMINLELYLSSWLMLRASLEKSAVYPEKNAIVRFIRYYNSLFNYVLEEIGTEQLTQLIYALRRGRWEIPPAMMEEHPEFVTILAHLRKGLFFDRYSLLRKMVNSKLMGKLQLVDQRVLDETCKTVGFEAVSDEHCVLQIQLGEDPYWTLGNQGVEQIDPTIIAGINLDSGGDAAMLAEVVSLVPTSMKSELKEGLLEVHFDEVGELRSLAVSYALLANQKQSQKLLHTLKLAIRIAQKMSLPKKV